MATILNKRPFSAVNRCPICGGYEGLDRQSGRRCYGFYATDENGTEWANCTRPELAGPLQAKPNGSYGHKLHGPCGCGQTHHEDRFVVSDNLIEHNVNGHSKPKNRPNRTPDKIWDYPDAQARLLFQVVRWDEPGGKVVRQRRPSPTWNGNWRSEVASDWLWTTDDVPRVLYNLLGILNNPTDPVFLAEGEKCADAVIDMGLVGTCTSMGASNYDKTDLSPLKGRTVFIFPDNDEAGVIYAEGISGLLKGVARSVTIIHLPGLQTKDDIYDWLYRYGHSREELIDLIERNRPKKTRYHSSELHLIAPPRWLLKPFLQAGGINLLSGEGGVGKTFLALDMAERVAQKDPVIYIAAEDPSQFPDRINAWQTYHQNKDDQFWLDTTELNLLEPQTVQKIINDYEDITPALVVIDTWAAATPGSDENNNGQIQQILNRAKLFLERWPQAAILVIHHLNAEGLRERGGGALRGGVVVAMIADQEVDGLMVSYSKVRNDAMPLPQHFGWETVEITDSAGCKKRSRVIIPTSSTFISPDLSDNQKIILSWLGLAIRRNQFYGASDIYEPARVKKSTFFPAVDKLKVMGLVEYVERRGYKITPMGIDYLEGTGILNYKQA